jgi:hypothetical protein
MIHHDHELETIMSTTTSRSYMSPYYKQVGLTICNRTADLPPDHFHVFIAWSLLCFHYLVIFMFSLPGHFHVFIAWYFQVSITWYFMFSLPGIWVWSRVLTTSKGVVQNAAVEPAMPPIASVWQPQNRIRLVTQGPKCTNF